MRDAVGPLPDAPVWRDQGQIMWRARSTTGQDDNKGNRRMDGLLRKEGNGAYEDGGKTRSTTRSTPRCFFSSSLLCTSPFRLPLGIETTERVDETETGLADHQERG